MDPHSAVDAGTHMQEGSVLDGSTGALQNLGISPLPIGTLKEVEDAGLDPQLVASCHPSSPGRIRGCALWKRCPFGQARMGGFKGKSGPRYVGYRLMTHEGNIKEDTMLCHGFVRTMQSRATQAVIDRQEGRRAEIVRVIAQEGQMIKQRVAVPDNPGDKSLTAGYHYEVKEVPVQHCPRPLELDLLNYEQEMLGREAASQQAERDVEDEAFARVTVGTEPEPFLLGTTQAGKKLKPLGRASAVPDDGHDDLDGP